MSPIYTFCTAVVANPYLFSHCIMMNIGSLILVNCIMMQCFSNPVMLMGLSASALVAAGVASLISLAWGGYAGFVAVVLRGGGAVACCDVSALGARCLASVTFSAALGVSVISMDAPCSPSYSIT